MKSDTQLMNELARKTQYLHELTQEESAEMKRQLLGMYQDIVRLCDREGLTVMMCGGTCLGTVRHQGYIPWDDDLDLMMPRRDYERLLQLLQEGALSECYEYSAPNKEQDSANVWLKIYKKGTTCVDLYNIHTPFPKGLFIDVFALDGVPDTRLAQRCKGLVANALQFCSILALLGSYPNSELGEYMAQDPVLKRRYKYKRMLGKIVALIPRRRWNYWFDRWVKDTSDRKKWGIPTGRKYYCGEIFPREVYVPTIEAEFEQVKVKIPNGYDAYLTNLYHDYMQLPPVEKRERHFTYQFELSK